MTLAPDRDSSPRHRAPRGRLTRKRHDDPKMDYLLLMRELNQDGDKVMLARVEEQLRLRREELGERS